MDQELTIEDSSFGDSALLALTGSMIIATLIFVVFGLHTIYTYTDTSKIVGGDAYNYIIIGVRGLAWICTGIVTAILAALFAHLRK